MQINRTAGDEAVINTVFLGMANILGLHDGVELETVLKSALFALEELGAGRKLAGDPRDQAAEYLLQLRRFTKKNEIPRDLASRIRKAGEELGELAEAMVNGNLSEIMSEAGDGINVLVDVLIICSGDNPRSSLNIYPFLIQNLRDKAEKYDQGENRTGERA